MLPITRSITWSFYRNVVAFFTFFTPMNTKLTLVLVLLLALMSCGRREQKPLSNDDALIMKFIIDTYNAQMYEDYDFLEAHCSQSLLNQLAADYYDTEDGGYAVWDFRTMSQDSKSDVDTAYGIITLRLEGDGWYSYEFFDSGFRGINRVKASIQNGEVMFEKLEKVYDETADF